MKIRLAKNSDPSKEFRWYLTALNLLFITLKLTGVIDWSWWWVFAPVWCPAIVAVPLSLVWAAFFVLNKHRRGEQ